MSLIKKFFFPHRSARGIVVALDDVWQEIQSKRSHELDAVVNNLLGEMTAAALLMQASIKWKGSVVLQIRGEGRVKMAVSQAYPDGGLRCTASLDEMQSSPLSLAWSDWVNRHGKGICAVTLDPVDRVEGQRPYQGMISMNDEHGQPYDNLSQALTFYMKRSEQIDTIMVLAANQHKAFGLMLQHVPETGGHGAWSDVLPMDKHDMGDHEHFNHLSILASSLQGKEMLECEVDTILRRLFWEEELIEMESADSQHQIKPYFFCTCSLERVKTMLVAMGQQECEEIIKEKGLIETNCDFCGQHYVFEPQEILNWFR